MLNAPHRLYHESAYDPTPQPSWWEASAPDLGFETPALDGDAKCEVAIVGSGYTGLSAAIALAEQGVSVIVLDAARPGWGASGRNGGFCCFGGTRKDPVGLIKAHGVDGARAIVSTQIESIETVAERIDRYGFDVDKHGQGEVIFAHRPKYIAEIQEEAQIYREKLGVDASYWSPETSMQAGLPGAMWHGGLHIPHGFGLHPLKYLRGLAREAHKQGVIIHGSTGVTDVREAADGVRLTTGSGVVSAETVLFATNGYQSENLPEWIGGRFMPALSAIMVTRPLTDDERNAQGWTGDTMCADTRALLHYFRMLPDGRFLFGGRGGVDTRPGALKRIFKGLRHAFDRMFPVWRDVEATHHWSGLVCLTQDEHCFLGRVPGTDRSFASMGYWGSGVAMASWAGERIAADIITALPTRSSFRAGSKHKRTNRPIPAPFAKPPGRYPFPQFRKLGLRLAYVSFSLRDEWL